MDQELKEYLQQLESRMDERFSQIDGRFSQIDGRLSQIDERFSQIDERLSQIDGRFNQIDDTFQQMETRLKEHMAGVVDAAKEEMKDFARQTARDMETRIVGSFSEVAATHETRLRTTESFHENDHGFRVGTDVDSGI